MNGGVAVAGDRHAPGSGNFSVRQNRELVNRTYPAGSDTKRGDAVAPQVRGFFFFVAAPE